MWPRRRHDLSWQAFSRFDWTDELCRLNRGALYVLRECAIHAELRGDMTITGPYLRRTPHDV